MQPGPVLCGVVRQIPVHMDGRMRFHTCVGPVTHRMQAGDNNRLRAICNIFRNTVVSPTCNHICLHKLTRCCTLKCQEYCCRTLVFVRRSGRASCNYRAQWGRTKKRRTGVGVVIDRVFNSTCRLTHAHHFASAAGGADARLPWLQAKLAKCFDGIKGDKIQKILADQEMM